MAILTSFPRIADPFKQGSHSGLAFAYGLGVVRADNVVVKVAAGTVTLTDDATNYVEVATDGTVSSNTTSYTSGQIPLFTVVVASGAITEVQDDRCFFSVGGGAGGGSQFDLSEVSYTATFDTLAALTESAFLPPA